MRRNIQNTVSAFIEGRKHNERIISTDGEILRSYLMPIALKKNGTIFIVNKSESPSKTTDLHIDAIDFFCELLKLEHKIISEEELFELRHN